MDEDCLLIRRYASDNKYLNTWNIGSKSTSLITGFLFVSSGLYNGICFLLCFFFCPNMLILSLPLLGLYSKSTFLSAGYCVYRLRQYSMICWEFDLFFRIFCFLIDCLGGQNQWMWLVSFRRQGMLTQVPTQDPKCNFNISLFLTLPHPLNYLICAKDNMIILFLQHMIGRWEECMG